MLSKTQYHSVAFTLNLSMNGRECLPNLHDLTLHHHHRANLCRPEVRNRQSARKATKVPEVSSRDGSDGHRSAHVKYEGRGGTVQSAGATAEPGIDVDGERDYRVGRRGDSGREKCHIGAEECGVEGLFCLNG